MQENSDDELPFENVSERRYSTTGPKERDNLVLHHHLSHGLPCNDYESLDYDLMYNRVYKKLVTSFSDKFRKFHAFTTWVMMFAIGFLTACVGMAIDVVVEHLMDAKFDNVSDSVDKTSKDGKLAYSLLLMLAFNMPFVFIATFLTYFEPLAAGSGIPEVKCYLNGVKMPNVTRLKTLVIKATGVLFSVAGGLFVGREGPMIHSGAVVAAGLPQFKFPYSWTKHQKCANLKDRGYRHFRTDRQKRDFVSAGAAAGVAAAFGAPIGGVLFSLEEGSSFWNQALTWKSLACAMTSTATLNFFLSGIDYGNWRSFDNPGLLNFGSFECPKEAENCTLWSLPDVLMFVVMGVIGGLLGALFNQLNYYLTRWRILHVIPKGRGMRMLEALLVVGVTTLFTFTASMTLGQCLKMNDYQTDNNETVSLRSFFCVENEFNDMATLFFNGQEASIKALFHTKDSFSPTTLVIFLVVFFFLACWTYGIMVPSGLFVPSILCGAAYGRLFGHFMSKWEVFGTSLYAGSYALIGSAAFVGGVVRMTISLTVILIETTNQITYGLPIMITLLTAKFVGDLFNIGLYDIHNEMKGIPFLEFDAPEGMESLEARDIMEHKLRCLMPHSTLEHVMRLLMETKHNAFPVVTPDHPDTNMEESLFVDKVPTTLVAQNIRYRLHSISEAPAMRSSQRRTNSVDKITEKHFAQELFNRYNEIKSNPHEPMSNVRFHGLIMRNQLIGLLKKKVCYKSTEGALSQREIDYWELNEDYPRFPDIRDVDMSSMDPWDIIDLTPYMNDSPYTVSPHLLAPKVFNLFRTMGLRHLPVVNNVGEIVGMITRQNLTHEALLTKLMEKEANITTSPN